MIVQTLKALDFLLKKSVLTTVVFYTHKKKRLRRGEHSKDQRIVSPEAIFSNPAIYTTEWI